MFRLSSSSYRGLAVMPARTSARAAMRVTGREVTHTDPGRRQHTGPIVGSSLALQPADRRHHRHTEHIRPRVVQAAFGQRGPGPSATAVPWDIAVTFDEEDA
jgi:hypothetical protein